MPAKPRHLPPAGLFSSWTALLVSLCALVGLTGSLAGVEARVRTLQGHDYVGQIRWEAGGLVLVNAESRLWVRVPVAEVSMLWVEDPPEADSSGAGTDAVEERLGPDGLPAGWTVAEVGGRPLESRVHYRDGAYRIESRGGILGHDEDSCRFICRRWDGDVELVARVGRCSPSHEEARAGLMFRVDQEAATPAVFWGATASLGDVCEWRVPGEAAFRTEATPAVPGMRWFKLQRAGRLISAYRSRDGARWILAGQTNLDLPVSLWVGMAAAGVTDSRAHSAVFEHVAVARRFPGAYRVRTELRSGSLVESPGLDFDRSRLRFHGVETRPAVFRDQVSRILLQPIPGRLEPRLRIGQPGVLLGTGDFLEGEVRSVEDGWVLLDSVLTGVRRLDLVNQVAALVFRPAAKSRAAYEVRMKDGSLWHAESVAVDGVRLRIVEPLLGECQLPLADLRSVEATGR